MFYLHHPQYIGDQLDKDLCGSKAGSPLPHKCCGLIQALPNLPAAVILSVAISPLIFFTPVPGNISKVKSLAVKCCQVSSCKMLAQRPGPVKSCVHEVKDHW